jgi:anthranilate synthase component I
MRMRCDFRRISNSQAPEPPNPMSYSKTRCERYSCGTRPALLGVHAADPKRYPMFLESSAPHPSVGRYDILFAGPGETIVGKAFLSALDGRWQLARQAFTEHGVPFVGGWFIYLGYELAGEIESTLNLPQSAAPLAFAQRMHGAAIYDHSEQITWLVAEPGHEGLIDELSTALRTARDPIETTAPALTSLEEEPAALFLERVAATQAHISAGDVYQVNLSRAWHGRLAHGIYPAALYARLRRANPSPFGGIVQLPWTSVLSTSPERLVECRDGQVQTRPIAGTHPRVGNDSQVIAALSAHPKERAEHVMLLDLERSDLGRISEPGSVTVDEYAIVESYAHVHHLVSNVRGRLRADVSPIDVIRAVFPGGTITGCPKIRCMQIIAALEGEAREAYTGSCGYLGLDGSLDLNILIRTATLAGHELVFRTGAGIVADSDPLRELEETRAKARGLLRVFGHDE